MNSPGITLPPIPEDVQARLNNAYWDGLRLGDDQTLPLMSLEASKGMKKFAADVLASELASGYGPALETYSNFIPEYHGSGTVIIFERESLFPEEPEADFVDMREFSGLALPAIPSREDLKANDKRALDSFRPYYRKVGGLVYEAAMYVGVTAVNSRGQIRLVTMPAAVLQESVEKPIVNGQVQPGKVCISPRARPKTEARPIEVGKTLHLKGIRRRKQGTWTEEKLVRVNVLEVIA